MTETGTKTYVRTENDNVTDGTAASTETGNDAFTLGEGSQTVSDTEYYTTTTTQNSLLGTFSTVTVGHTASLSDNYTDTESGNTFAGTTTRSLTGTTRYDQLSQFNNTADSANGGVGLADFSPVGLPIYVGRASVPAGVFTQVGDAQYEYCFAGENMVLMADRTLKLIHQVKIGDIVLAVPDHDPQARPRPCR